MVSGNYIAIFFKSLIRGVFSVLAPLIILDTYPDDKSMLAYIPFFYALYTLASYLALQFFSLEKIKYLLFSTQSLTVSIFILISLLYQGGQGGNFILLGTGLVLINFQFELETYLHHQYQVSNSKTINYGIANMEFFIQTGALFSGIFLFMTSFINVQKTIFLVTMIILINICIFNYWYIKCGHIKSGKQILNNRTSSREENMRIAPLIVISIIPLILSQVIYVIYAIIIDGMPVVNKQLYLTIVDKIFVVSAITASLLLTRRKYNPNLLIHFVEILLILLIVVYGFNYIVFMLAMVSAFIIYSLKINLLSLLYDSIGKDKFKSNYATRVICKIVLLLSLSLIIKIIDEKNMVSILLGFYATVSTTALLFFYLYKWKIKGKVKKII